MLEAEADYDEYCYIAAGTVGHLATELVIEQYQLSEGVTPTLHALAEACGRSMQKTNIVKDFVVDLRRGISYLPDTWLRAADYAPLALRGAAPAWNAMVLEDVLDEFRAATEYGLALPYSAQGYRRASLLCLLPAYQTIYLAAQRQEMLFTSEHKIKISRPTMGAVSPIHKRCCLTTKQSDDTVKWLRLRFTSSSICASASGRDNSFPLQDVCRHLPAARSGGTSLSKSISCTAAVGGAAVDCGGKGHIRGRRRLPEPNDASPVKRSCSHRSNEHR